MNIIVLGPPGSGKGTQAELLAKKLNLYHLQTGQIARELAKKDDRIREMVNSGKLVPAEEMTMYVLDFLHSEGKNLTNILFEGFPRFITQYEALEQFLKNKGDDIDAVISLEITKDEVVKRLSGRRTCESCGKIYNTLTNPPKVEGVCDNCGGKLIQRDDDTPESIKVRFEYYYANTKELTEYLDKKGKLIKIDAARPIEVIFEDILSKMEKIWKK